MQLSPTSRPTRRAIAGAVARSSPVWNRAIGATVCAVLALSVSA